MITQDFLNFLFTYKQGNQYILIWTVPGKESRFFQDISKAANYVETIKEARNVYFGLGLHDHPQHGGGRGSTSDIVGIPALWLDIDIADTVHKKKNLPASPEDALDVIHKIQWKPSMVVNSGHGLHLYWRFREVFEFTSEEERRSATILVQKFQSYIRSLFLMRGWTLDSTHDLTRVLRVAGTKNIKEEPLDVFIEYMLDDREYNVTDFDDLPDIQDDVDTPSTAVTVDMGGLILDPKAEPPSEKLLARLDCDLNFSLTWNHKRKDFPSGDYSQSTYDQSLATQAAMSEWTDQEIINLVISNRRMFKADLKLRQDYFKKLLENAKRTAQKQRAHEDIDSGVGFDEKQIILPDGNVSTVVECPENVWSTYSKLWEFNILRVVRTNYDPPTFRMETDHGRVEFGGPENIMNQTNFRARVAARTKKVIDREKGKEWDRIAKFLIMSAQDEEPGVEATDIGLISSWMRQYLEDRIPTVEEDDRYIENVEGMQPFIFKGQTYFFLASFRSWIMATKRETVTRQKLSSLLHMIGSNDRSHEINPIIPKNAWLVPQTFTSSLAGVVRQQAAPTLPSDESYDIITGELEL